jgi:hypothetical protein
MGWDNTCRPTVLPSFNMRIYIFPRGQFAVKVRLVDLGADKLSIGTHGVVEHFFEWSD